MFADIDDFYDYSRQRPAEQFLSALDAFFSCFDEVAERFHLRKIKTIGDAYMCAGGIPAACLSHPADVVRAALDVQQHLNRLRKQNPDLWTVRFGVHTGEVYAGFLGKTELTYDIWGATVNLAARIESMCPKGKILISNTTFDRVKNDFTCEYAGALPEKLGKGELYLIDNGQLTIDNESLLNHY